MKLLFKKIYQKIENKLYREANQHVATIYIPVTPFFFNKENFCFISRVDEVFN